MKLLDKLSVIDIISAIKETYKIIDYPIDDKIKESENQKNIMLRKQGHLFSFNEHIKAFIYSLLTSQNKWSRVEPKLNEIDKLFYDYDIKKLKSMDSAYYYLGLRNLKCGSQVTHKQMNVLQENLSIFELIVKDYASMDTFITSESTYNIAIKLSEDGSKYKLKQIGIPLALEYMRNVGIDALKPDTHIIRMFGKNRLGFSIKEKPSVKETLAIAEEISKHIGITLTELDSILWHFCADNKAEICSSIPRCEICKVSSHCSKNVSNLTSKKYDKKMSRSFCHFRDN